MEESGAYPKDSRSMLRSSSSPSLLGSRERLDLGWKPWVLRTNGDLGSFGLYALLARIGVVSATYPNALVSGDGRERSEGDTLSRGMRVCMCCEGVTRREDDKTAACGVEVMLSHTESLLKEEASSTKRGFVVVALIAVVEPSCLVA